MPSASPATPWWRHAVIYEIYVRSFQDSNGDGVGDLCGITQRLGYLQDLGVDAIWLTPFFPSPNADFGYDVSNYTDVAPEYGTLADWDELVREASACGIRVLVDFVLNHCSDQHPWFVEARASRDNPKRDWFVWKDGAPNAEEGEGPPTNWRSIFGGPAWTRDATTGQWYYHAFLPQQPDLNWHNAELRAAMFDVAHFWLRRGASGFRLDATAHLFEDPAYPQDPAPDTPAASPLRPWMAGRPENHGVLRELRALVDGYPGDPVLLGESSTDSMDELVAAYGANDDEIQLPMNFMFARHWQRDAATFKRLIDGTHAALPGRTPVFFFSSHDHPRQWNLFGDGENNDAIARLTAALTLTQRGTVLLYAGEEIGMADLDEGEWAAAPLGPNRPNADARDRNRTPMQWHGGAHAGFTGGTPWLPAPADIGLCHVSAQQSDPDSIYHWYRALLALRRADAVFRDGAHVPLDSGHPEVLAFGRRLPDGRGAVVLLNFSASAQRVRLSGWPGGKPAFSGVILAHPRAGLPVARDFNITPFGVWMGRVDAAAGGAKPAHAAPRPESPNAAT
jgi:alpha-glucosidase